MLFLLFHKWERHHGYLCIAYLHPKVNFAVPLGPKHVRCKSLHRATFMRFSIIFTSALQTWPEEMQTTDTSELAGGRRCLAKRYTQNIRRQATRVRGGARASICTVPPRGRAFWFVCLFYTHENMSLNERNRLCKRLPFCYPGAFIWIISLFIKIHANIVKSTV